MASLDLHLQGMHCQFHSDGRILTLPVWFSALAKSIIAHKFHPSVLLSCLNCNVVTMLSMILNMTAICICSSLIVDNYILEYRFDLLFLTVVLRDMTSEMVWLIR